MTAVPSAQHGPELPRHPIAPLRTGLSLLRRWLAGPRSGRHWLTGHQSAHCDTAALAGLAGQTAKSDAMRGQRAVRGAVAAGLLIAAGYAFQATQVLGSLNLTGNLSDLPRVTRQRVTAALADAHRDGSVLVVPEISLPGMFPDTSNGLMLAAHALKAARSNGIDGLLVERLSLSAHRPGSRLPALIYRFQAAQSGGGNTISWQLTPVSTEGPPDRKLGTPTARLVGTADITALKAATAEAVETLSRQSVRVPAAGSYEFAGLDGTMRGVFTLAGPAVIAANTGSSGPQPDRTGVTFAGKFKGRGPRLEQIGALLLGGSAALPGLTDAARSKPATAKALAGDAKQSPDAPPSITASVTLNGAVLTFAELALVSAGSRATGVTTIDWRSEKPGVTATLDFDTVDIAPVAGVMLRHLWPTEPPAQARPVVGAAGNARVAAFVRPQAAAIDEPSLATPPGQRQAGSTVQRAEKIPPASPWLDLSARISSRQVRVGAVETGRGAVAITARGGQMRADVIDWQLPSGSATGRLAVDTNHHPARVRIEAETTALALASLPVGTILGGQFQALTGTLGAKMRLSATLADRRDPLTTLDGTVHLDVADGNLPLDLAGLFAATRDGELSGWQRGTPVASQTPFDRLTAKIVVRDGRAFADRMRAALPTGHIIADAALNLADEQMLLRLDMSGMNDVRAGTDAPAPTVVIRGPLRRPTIHLEKLDLKAAPAQ